MNLRMLSRSVTGVFLALSCFAASAAHAISEREYVADYLNVVVPFMRANAVATTFKARDGMELSAVRIVNPHATKGTIVVVTGRSEPWLKYGEVFYDLYQQGYSLYSYDHRGQGLSPHLSAKNPQIGHIEDFGDYVRDFEDFMSKVVPRDGGNLYLLAHSMGGGIAAAYLSRGATPFKAAVLSAPMLSIDTKPFPHVIALAITGSAISVGKADEYAHNQKDFDPTAPFETNDVTGSRERFWMSNSVFETNPKTVIGGPSNGWVYRSLLATPKIARKMKGIRTPTLLFQAGLDQKVRPDGENRGCASTKACRLVVFPTSQHEILMEKDAIRDRAFSEILRFFRSSR
jgi:lysophospholipase